MAGVMVNCSRTEPRCGSVAIATLHWLAFKQSLVMSMGDGPALDHYVEVCLCVRVCCLCVCVCVHIYLFVYLSICLSVCL